MDRHTKLHTLVTDLAKRNGLSGFECSSNQLSLEPVHRYLLCDVYRMTSSPEGASCHIKTRNIAHPAVLVQSYFERESLVTRILNDVSVDVCPVVMACDPPAVLSIMEDLCGYESLWERLITQSRVDHGVTCTIARRLGSMHKATHHLSLGEAGFSDLVNTLGDSPSTSCLLEAVFTRPYNLNDLSSDLGPETRKSAIQILGDNTFRTQIAAISQDFTSTKECLIHANLNMTNIVIRDCDNVKVADLGFGMVGPAYYDLGCLVAQYLMTYYIHILTEENNSSHRQVAYCMQDAVRHTVDAYLEMQTTDPENIDRGRLMSSISAYAGIELIRRSLEIAESSSFSMLDHTRVSILQSGQRLVNKHRSIDNVGRLLMIALQLC